MITTELLEDEKMIRLRNKMYRSWTPIGVYVLCFVYVVIISFVTGGTKPVSLIIYLVSATFGGLMLAHYLPVAIKSYRRYAKRRDMLIAVASLDKKTASSD